MDKYWIDLYLRILVLTSLAVPLKGDDRGRKVVVTPAPRQGFIYPKYAILFRGEEDTFEVNLSIPKNVDYLGKLLSWKIEDTSKAYVLSNETIEVRNYTSDSVEMFYSTVTVSGLRLGKTWLSIEQSLETESHNQVCLRTGILSG